MSLNIVKYVNNRKLNNLFFHIKIIYADTQICDAELFRDPHKYLLEVRVTPYPMQSIYCIACRKTGVGDTKRKSQTRKIEEALARNAGANLERNTTER